MAESCCYLNEPIGGFFELELPRHTEYHKDAIKLNTGRNCLEYILRSRKYSKVYIPYYTCDAILEPFYKLNIKYDFYHINLDFEIKDIIPLEKGEGLLYTNYFGLKQKYAENLASKYGQQLIIDNTQAFYAKPINGIDTFYSCRKFFGVPDGAYLYTDKLLNIEFERDISWQRMEFLTKRIDLGASAAYGVFNATENTLINQPIKCMSSLTERLMKSIDYRKIAQRRKKNFRMIHLALCKKNMLKIQIEDDTISMVYPFLCKSESLRGKLIDQKIYVATYWQNVTDWTDSSSVETILSRYLIALPIDQRNDNKKIEKILQYINGRI